MDNSQEQSNNYKRKYYIKPINICVKYNPPTLGILYEYIGDSSRSKNYIHQIKVTMNHNSNVNEIYERLYKREPYYFNSKYINKDQVIKLLENIKNYISMKEINSQRNKNFSFEFSNSNNLMNNKIFLEDKSGNNFLTPKKEAQLNEICPETQCSDNLFDNNEFYKNSPNAFNHAQVQPIKPRLRPENCIISQYEEYTKKYKMKKDSLKEKLSKLSIQGSSVSNSLFWKKRKLSQINPSCEKSNMEIENNFSLSKSRCRSNRQRGKTEIDIDAILNLNPFGNRRKKINKNKSNKQSEEGTISNMEKYLKSNEQSMNLQKVFVEDLGRELYMDNEGNLFDERGNFIGQADIDDLDLGNKRSDLHKDNTFLKENSI